MQPERPGWLAALGRGRPGQRRGAGLTARTGTAATLSRRMPCAVRARLASRAGYITEAKLDKVEALSAWAAERGLTVLELAIGGLAALPGCSSVIAGATTAQQVKANAEAASWIPAPDEIAQLDSIAPPPGDQAG